MNTVGIDVAHSNGPDGPTHLPDRGRSARRESNLIASSTLLSMLGTSLSILGLFLVAIGTFVRVMPDLNRGIRRHYYRNAPLTRDLFRIRKDVKHSPRWRSWTISNERVCREFIDYIDANDIVEPPDELPIAIGNQAADLVAEFSDGSDERYLRGGISKQRLVEILTNAIERSCRNSGLGIAFVGTLTLILGRLM